MKTIFAVIFFAVLLPRQSFGQQIQKKVVYMYPNESTLELLLTKQGIEYKREKLDIYAIKLGNHRCMATIQNTTLYLRAAFNSDTFPIQVNNFNKKYSWVRLYLDGPTLIVADELDFRGGVTEEGLSFFLKTYDLLLKEVEKQLF